MYVDLSFKVNVETKVEKEKRIKTLDLGGGYCFLFSYVHEDQLKV